MNKNALYLVTGVVIAAILFFAYMNGAGSLLSRIRGDRIERPLPLESESEPKFVKDKTPPSTEREEGKDNTDANQNKTDEEAKRELEYKKWMKSNHMENEGVKPFDFETRGIAGGLQQYYELFQITPMVVIRR